MRGAQISRLHRHKKWLLEKASWIFVIGITTTLLAALILGHARAATSGKMTLYLHKEASDINETYDSLSFSPSEPAADTASTGGATPTAFNSAAPALCEDSGNTGDTFNSVTALGSVSTGEKCMASFVSPRVGGSGFTIGATEASVITASWWASKSTTTTLTVTPNMYIYVWDGASSYTLVKKFTALQLSTANVTQENFAPAVASDNASPITVSPTNRIVVILTMTIGATRNNATMKVYFDSTARAASFVTLSYTSGSYNTANKPALSGNMDDDFNTNSSSTTCNSSGVPYNNKWSCLQGSAANTSGAFNSKDLTNTGSGDSSNWLWLTNQTTTTTAVTSDFGTTPSNTFLFQPLPSAYGDGNIRTVLNATSTFGVGASTPTAPFNHVGLVLWTSNTDYLELQVYSTGATTGTNSVVVALNNSGTLGSTTSLNATTSSGIFNEVWLGFTNTGGSWQAQYSTDGTTWNNVGTAVSHSTNFKRVGLNAFTKIANPVSTYGGAFEWFQYGLATVTYNQTGFEFFDNANSTTPGTAHGINTNYTLASTGAQFRLRQLVHATGTVGSSSNYSVQTMSTATAAGESPKVAVGNDNLARVAYSLASGGTYYIQCINLDCTSLSSTTISTDTTSSLFHQVASDGYSRLLYADSTASALVYVQCTASNCSTNNSTNVVTGSAPTDDSFVIAPADGFARIAYIDSSSNVSLITCTNASCSSSSSTTGITTSGTVQGLTIAMGLDGFPRITYSDSSTLHYIQCTNASCSTKVDTSLDTIQFLRSSLDIASDGFARIAYAKASTEADFIQCTNDACSTNVKTVVSSTNKYTHAKLGSDGFERIVSGNNAGNSVVIIFCTNASCSSSTTNTVSVTTPDAGYGLTLDLDPDNDVFISVASNTTSSDLIVQSHNFKLQYAVQGSACSSASYSNVTTSTPIAYYANATPSTGSTITYQSGTDPTESGQTVVGETYQQDMVPLFNPVAFGGSVDGEWDFSLFDNGASSGTAYCLRLVDGTGTAITTYTNYPIITTNTPGPTMDQVMRGGNWFNNSGVKQSYFWAQ